MGSAWNRLGAGHSALVPGSQALVRGDHPSLLFLNSGLWCFHTKHWTKRGSKVSFESRHLGPEAKMRLFTTSTCCPSVKRTR